jgi:spoIIIJ-associated protein
MKRIRMKGKTVDAATEAALGVLGGSKENAKVYILNEGKPAVLGVIGGEEAEVEVVLKEGPLEDARGALQEVLDKMAFLAVAEGKEGPDGVELSIKGEDLGRIIGKEGGTLRALEILIGAMVGRHYEERIRVNIDAGEYKEKRKKALERLASDAAEEVAKTGREKVLPHLDAGDRRIVHMYLKENAAVSTLSKGEGKDRRLVIVPR